MNVGVVVIGRNEGERLRRCIQSMPATAPVVYVDSGSSDDSVNMVRGMGKNVVELDMRTPFTAARARNAGFKRLQELVPGLDYVQFVDGDCELAGGWMDKAAAFLANNEGVAVICGRLRETRPELSVYNRLCDIEWDAPAGEAKSCGGIAMMHAKAFAQVDGFREDLIAGEESELCIRLRSRGWRIWRAADDMGLHDAAMTRFGQWWKRSVRTGYSFAQGANLHGASPERHRLRESRSAWMWGLCIPLFTFVLALVWGPWALLTLTIYPLQIVRLAMRGARASGDNWSRAGFLVLGKFPEMLGQVKFLTHHFLGRQARLIEHK